MSFASVFLTVLLLITWLRPLSMLQAIPLSIPFKKPHGHQKVKKNL